MEYTYSMNEKKSASLIDYLEIIVKWRKFIIRNVIIVTVAAVIISLLLTQVFTATATILPPNPEQQTMLGLLSYNVPGGLSSLSRMGGVFTGIATPSDLFAAIMKSGRIRGAIIRKYDLMKEFNVKKMSEASEALDGITRITVSPEGMISVSVTYKNKHLAADIANSFIEELDRFNTETAMTTGRKYRIFIEERLQANIDTLALAEEALRKFQEKHRTIALEEEIESAIATIAELKSQIILLEVKKGALASSSQFDNPYLYDINKELRELKKQLAKIEFGDKSKEKEERNGFGVGFAVPFSELPEVAVEYARLLRDVEVQSAIYELLTQQYEQAKIMELKDTPTVQFLDRASPPEKRSFPKRKIIVIIAFFVSLVINTVLVFFLETIKQAKAEKNTEYARWLTVYNQIIKDLNAIKVYIKNVFKWKK